MPLLHADHEGRWPHATVPYVLEERQFPTGSRGRAGIDRVSAYLRATTGVRLVPRTGQGDHLRIVRVSDRPASHVGRLGGAQDLHCAIGDLVLRSDGRQTYTETSEAAPGLCSEGDAGARYVMAWRGVDNGWLNLARVTPGVAGVSDKVTVETACEQAPSVVRVPQALLGASGSHLWCATVVDGALTVFRTAVGFAGGAVIPRLLRVALTTRGAGEQRPASAVGLCRHDGGFALTWCTESGRIVVARAEETGQFAIELTSITHLPETSPSPPCVQSHNGALYLGWRGEDDRINIAVSRGDPTTFTDKATSEQQSAAGVSLASAAQGPGLPAELYAAWRDPEERIGLARVRDVAGPGPVGLHQLWQDGLSTQDTTSAAPALATAGTEDRMLLAWVGSGNTSLNTVPLGVRDDGALVHELGHALGLFHEHQRKDRESHVRYVGPRDDEYDVNYSIRTEQTHIEPYDATSRMHYAAGNRLQPQPGVGVTPSAGFSALDNAALRFAYPITGVTVRDDTTEGAPALSALRPGDGAVVVAWRGSGNDDLNFAVCAVDLVPTPAGALFADGFGAHPPTAAGAGTPPLPAHVPFPATPPPSGILRGGMVEVGSQWFVRTLTERSPHGPTVAGSVVAWTGTDDRVCLASLGEGVVRWKLVLGATSPCAPAVAELPGGDLLVAWTGEDEFVNLAVVDARGRIRNQVVTRQTSESAPALAVDLSRDRAYAAWRGTGNDQLNVAPVRLNGVQAGAATVGSRLDATTLNDETTDTGPSLAVVGHQVVLGWKGAGNENLNLMVSTDSGASFTHKHTSGERSEHAPALACVTHGWGRQRQEILVVAWRGVGNDRLNLAAADLAWP